MRSPLNLLGWIVLLGILQASSLVLDRSQHLLWGRGGLILLKASYVAFAMVLLVRFLSFRSQKSFESMLDSFNRISERPWRDTLVLDQGWRKFLFHLTLVVVASTNFITPFIMRESAFKASILLDLLFWSLSLRWIVRAHWLKSIGRREKLKESLDDVRSRLRSGILPDPPRIGKAAAWPFLVLLLLAVSVTAVLSRERWHTAGRIYWIGDLKACLLTCLESGLVAFHRDGRLDVDLSGAPCMARHRLRVDAGMGFKRGEILLWAIEKPKSDFFGNGQMGDQGLWLDAEGRFRDAGRRKQGAERRAADAPSAPRGAGPAPDTAP